MENGTTNKEDIAERLNEQLQAIATEAETLVSSKSQDLIEKTKEIRDRLASALGTAEETVAELENQATAGLKAADRSIREHPYQALGIAVAIGLALGLLIKRR